MILCRVIGNVVSTVQHRVYEGKTVLVVQPVDVDGRTPLGGEFLSVDATQAGVGDLVLASREGNTARQLLGGPDDPFHSVILGIVDDVTIDDDLATGAAIGDANRLR
ncbi:MAG: EutN/CcmL family microcompartment protein [Myxococcota bacterium]